MPTSLAIKRWHNASVRWRSSRGALASPCAMSAIAPYPTKPPSTLKGGISSFVRYLNRTRRPLHPVVQMERDVEVTPESKPPFTVGVEVAFQYTDSSSVTELAFANTINTPDGGNSPNRLAQLRHQRFESLCAEGGVHQREGEQPKRERHLRRHHRDCECEASGPAI
jgi:hypothetical protein